MDAISPHLSVNALTAGESMRRYFFLIITLMLALCLLTSCASCKDDGGLDKFEQLIVSTSSPEEEGEAFADAAYVVVSRSAGFELVSRAVALADTLTAKTGVATFLKYDSEPTVSGTFEILLGYNTRLVAKENFSSLRDGDYICRYDRGCIVLGGRTEEATLAAIDKFESDILPGASYAAIMSKDAHFEVYAEHEIEEFTINGYPIYEYTLAYCGESYEIADVISRYIREVSGYTISHKQKDAYDPQMSRCIWLILDGEGAASIAQRDGNIVLRASDLYGLSLAATTFTSHIGESALGASLRMNIEGNEVLSYAKSELDLAFGFVDNEGKSDFNLLLALANAINNTHNDLFCFYPTKNSLADDIEHNCPSGRSFMSVDLGNGISLPLIYRTNAYLSVTAERRDGTVWINARDLGGKVWHVRIDEPTDDDIRYESDEILLLSDLRIGDGNIDRIATVEYGTHSDKIERLIYSESATCKKSETIAEYSKENGYFGILSLELVERYHEDFIILKDSLKNTFN